ncbi:MAG: hypothetical protein HC830_08735 [Bacteroidetes bacterium]|nr:hypothetical protein [Bacteroidales bacterium]NJO69339.1 hypothetical protein [Bacteroidota bacterium]
MQTLLVEIKDKTGLRILQELEHAQLIRLIKTTQENIPQRLSSRLRGALSKETTKEMKSELEQMRSEWQQRDI